MLEEKYKEDRKQVRELIDYILDQMYEINFELANKDYLIATLKVELDKIEEMLNF